VGAQYGFDGTGSPDSLDYAACCSHKQSLQDSVTATSLNHSGQTCDSTDTFQGDNCQSSVGSHRLSPRLTEGAEVSTDGVSVGGSSSASLVKKAKKREEKGLGLIINFS